MNTNVKSNDNPRNVKPTLRKPNQPNTKPSILTYNLLISRSAMWQKLSKCEYFLRDMQLYGIAPDVRIYNSLINACK